MQREADSSAFFRSVLVQSEIDLTVNVEDYKNYKNIC